MTFQEQLMETLHNKGVSKPSIALYIRVLRSLGGSDFQNLGFLNDHKTNLEKIKISRGKKASENTVYNKLTAIRSVLQATEFGGENLYNFYKKPAESIKIKLIEKSVSGEKSEKEKNCWMKPNEIREILEKVKQRAHWTKSRDDINDYLIMTLYVSLVPRRLMDYALMILLRGNPPKVLGNTVNWLILKDNLMIFNQHKNTNISGTEYLNVKDNAGFQDALALHLSTLPAVAKSAKFVQSALLQHTNGKPYNGDDIRNTLYRLIKPGVSVTMLRKIFATELAPSKDMLEKIITQARLMSHDLTTHIRQYVKNEITDS
jgi:hypothetical protein